MIHNGYGWEHNTIPEADVLACGGALAATTGTAVVLALVDASEVVSKYIDGVNMSDSIPIQNVCMFCTTVAL